MKLYERYAEEWVADRIHHDEPRSAQTAYKAGFSVALQLAAVVGRLAQLERNVVDIEIMKILEREDG